MTFNNFPYPIDEDLNMRFEVSLKGVKADVVVNEFTAAMADVVVDVLVGAAMTASVPMTLELDKLSSCTEGLLAADWDEALVGVDLSIDMRTDEVIAVFTDAGVDAKTALDCRTLLLSLEEWLCFC